MHVFLCNYCVLAEIAFASLSILCSTPTVLFHKYRDSNPQLRRPKTVSACLYTRQHSCSRDIRVLDMPLWVFLPYGYHQSIWFSLPSSWLWYYLKLRYFRQQKRPERSPCCSPCFRKEWKKLSTWTYERRGKKISDTCPEYRTIKLNQIFKRCLLEESFRHRKNITHVGKWHHNIVQATMSHFVFTISLKRIKDIVPTATTTQSRWNRGPTCLDMDVDLMGKLWKDV